MATSATTADLEVRIVALHDLGWKLLLRLTRPDDAADILRGPFDTKLDPAHLLELQADPAAYGAALTAALFAENRTKIAFAETRAVVLQAQQTLRIRLLLPPELHALRWEMLLDSQNGRPLALEGDLLLSRYLSGDDYQRVQLQDRKNIRALVAVAAPTNAEAYGLAPINCADEVQRVREAFADTVQIIGDDATAIPVTWDNLATQLRKGCDLLYLVAHGALINGAPVIYLEHDDGTVAPTPGARLVDLLRTLGERRPQLVVLASCSSAGDGYANALAALGPQLAQAGVPVVLAMQGQISIASNALFQTIFFAELVHDGFADRAVSIARHAVRHRPDWWMPVLYTRLRKGRLWHAVASEEQEPYSEVRRLDAATPAQATVGVPTEVWVQICMPNSEGFKKDLPLQIRSGEEITRQDVIPERLSQISFPLDATGKPQHVRLQLQLEAPDFAFAERLKETLLVPGQDTARLIFHLTPHTARQISRMTVTVRYRLSDGVWAEIGAVRLQTRILSPTSARISQIGWSLSSIVLAAGALLSTIVQPSIVEDEHSTKHSHPNLDAPATLRTAQSATDGKVKPAPLVPDDDATQLYQSEQANYSLDYESTMRAMLPDDDLTAPFNLDDERTASLDIGALILKIRWTITVVSGDTAQPLELKSNQRYYDLGRVTRTRTPDLPLNHERVSRNHARIELLVGGPVLVVQETTHGTFFGPRKIALVAGDRQALSDGDIFWLSPDVQLQVTRKVEHTPLAVTDDGSKTELQHLEQIDAIHRAVYNLSLPRRGSTENTMSTPPADEPDARREPLITITGQTGDVTIGDVTGRDIHKPTIAPGGIYAPYGTVYPPSPPRSSVYDSAPEFTEQGIFVGRDSLLTEIRTRLTARPAARVALVGIPGSGKSRLARALFHNAELRGHFQGGILCAALGQSPSLELHITRWFREVLRSVDPQRLTIEQQAEQLRQHIAADERPWLCILDDLWSVHDITAFQTLLGVPALLITTRQQDVIEQLGDALSPLEDVFSIGKLDRSTAVDLLRERAGIASTEYDGELADLAALAGDLPVALTIIGGFLQGRTKRTAWMEEALQALARADAHESIDQIAQNYGRRRSWLRWLFGTEPIDKGFDVDRLLQMSYKLLPRDAQRAIIRLAALPPDPLSFDDQAASVVVDTRGDALQDALLLLTQRSLITALRQDDRFQMHRRVWEWAQRQAPQELQAAQERWRSWRFGASPEEATERNSWMQNRRNAELLLHAWREACGENDADRFDAAALRIMVFAAIPTLVQFGYGSVISSSLAQVARFFEQRRDMKAAGAAYGYLGGIELDRARFADARAHADRALGLLQAAADEVGQSAALNLLGMVAQNEGQYEEAEPLFREALEITERVLGAEHPDTATSLNNLAGLLESQGDYAAARPLYERALAISERVLGAEHPSTATSLNNLAGLLESQGDYAAARPLYERALALRERVLGAEHPSTATSLNNLAGLFHAQGDYAAARPLYERALAISERVLGAEHPDTALSLNNLAVFYAYQGDFAAAIPQIERALNIRRRALGPGHPDTISTKQSLDNMRRAASHPPRATDPAEALAPLLSVIAAIAAGDDAQRQAVTQKLHDLESKGWMLHTPVERIWAGERDTAALTHGLDEQDTVLIERILALIVAEEQS